MSMTIGKAAATARLSVRTLHHYDAIGLLRPTGRSEAGYRLYSAEDLQRLQQILVFRELGFALRDIKRIMNDPGFEARRALAAQRGLLAEKQRRGAAMLAAVDAALESLEKGTTMHADELFEGFGDFDPKDYEDEARERWGESEAYKESARRTSSYTKDDWRRIREESEAITAAFVDAMDRGLPADDPAAQAAVERHRQHMARYFYEPTLELYDGLADLWVDDVRFTKNIDKARQGLAAYQRAAVKAWVAARREDGAA
jgi:MerR family transcriptional regulator, thiopeptide resistance regulator